MKVLYTIVNEETEIVKSAPCDETIECRVDELYAVKNLTLNWNEIPKDE